MIQTTIPPSAHEFKCLYDYIKMINIEKVQFNDSDYPFTKKPSFSTLGIILEISRHEPFISFTPDYSIRDVLGFNPGTLNKNAMYHLIQLIYHRLIITSLRQISPKEKFLQVKDLECFIISRWT